MRLLASLLLALLLSGCATASLGKRSLANSSSSLRNELLPFTSDGCSRFPDGIPYLNEKKWLSCCVRHDILYWQGGTAEQRAAADEELRVCVAQKAGWALADAMYLGVRLGGYPGLPLTWRWGYGWTFVREYGELTADELVQVKTLAANIPANLDEVPIVPASVVPVRTSLTGDYCLDAAVKQMEISLGRPARVVSSVQEVKFVADGWRKMLSVNVEDCNAPFQFTFLLLRRNACETPVNELLARGRIRLEKMVTPKECVRDLMD